MTGGEEDVNEMVWGLPVARILRSLPIRGGYIICPNSWVTKPGESLPLNVSRCCVLLCRVTAIG